jgi:hypothetical protein
MEMEMAFYGKGTDLYYIETTSKFQTQIRKILANL